MLVFRTGAHIASAGCRDRQSNAKRRRFADQCRVSTGQRQDRDVGRAIHAKGLGSTGRAVGDRAFHLRKIASAAERRGSTTTSAVGDGKRAGLPALPDWFVLLPQRWR